MLRNRLLVGAFAMVLFSLSLQAQDFMGMFNSANQSAISIAGTMTMNSALCNQTNTCGPSQTPAQRARDNALQKQYRACLKSVISVTRSGTAARDNGYARCKAQDRADRAGFVASYADTPAISGDLRYGVSPRVEQEVKEIVLRAVHSRPLANPAGVDQMIRGANVERLFSDLMLAQGLQSQNLVDAMTGYWVTMWMIVNQTQMPSRSAIAGVHEQMRVAALRQGYANESDAFKQRESQVLMWQMVLALAGYRNPNSNRNELSMVMNDYAMQQGFDLANLAIGPRGFVAR